MKLKTFLEEFKTGIKHGKHYYEIFVNPTQKEIKEVGKNTGDMVRFIIDKKRKKVYVFPANLLHSYVTKELKIPYIQERSKDFGNARFIFSGNKIVKGKIRLPLAWKYLEKEFNWLERYFIK